MKHTPGPIKLYSHKTGGGAKYLMDKFIVCPNGEKEGIIEGAKYIVRLDGEPELMLKNAAPDLLEALKETKSALKDIIGAAENGQPYTSEELNGFALTAYNKAFEVVEAATGEDTD